MLGGVVFGTRTCQGRGLGGFGTVDLGMGRQITSTPRYQASSTLAIHPFQTIFILSTLSDSHFIPRITHIASTDTFSSTRAQKLVQLGTIYNIEKRYMKYLANHETHRYDLWDNDTLAYVYYSRQF